MYNKGYAYNQLGMREKAIKELEGALEKAAESSESRHKIILAALDKMKVKLAKIVYKMTITEHLPSHREEKTFYPTDCQRIACYLLLPVARQMCWVKWTS